MEIKPESKSLESILSGLETSYLVPDYQRDYSWSPNEVETLWTDIWNSFEQKAEYFMGTIVLKKRDDSVDCFDIVDGQQRLATFSVLFSVISSIAGSFANTPQVFGKVERNKENISIANRTFTIAVNRLREASEPDNYFLRLNKKDNDIFQKIIREEESVLISDDELKINKSDKRLIKTRKVFFSQIFDTLKDDGAIRTLNSLLVHMVKKLKFITIEVKTDYDAFLLFESLNSKGMDLSVSDLVKNKILMRAGGDEGKSDKLLCNWDEMISFIESSRLSPVDFLRIYWEAIRGINTTKKELYKYVSRYIDSNSTDILKFSADLKDKAESLSVYAASDLNFPESMHRKEKYLRYCGEINLLKYTTCYPLIMFIKEHRPEILDEISRISLSFLFRWITVGDFSVGGAKRVFDIVIKSAKNDSATLTDIIAPFKVHQDKIGDAAFKDSLKKFRTQDNQIAKYILSKVYLEQSKKESVPNYSEIHLEHVIPQQPSKWKVNGKFKVSEGAQIEDLIYSIGNMTLLNKSMNQKIKNDVFDEKCIYYKDSVFPQTKDIYDRFSISGEFWSVPWILSRCEEIADVADKIWPLEV
ncbi:DUF262 domain-containing HNH endonuclease family protein [Gallaecimonas sp. GXIMD4217]|uniref:DUF262 domain-containing protein n=1 Tax=Gallaecimonas sp. GXIMD4217 TaxID=3131927 RepID=UPI00311B1DCE